MGRVRVIITKRNNIPLEKEIRDYTISMADRQFFVLSEETVKEIKNKIAESIQRPGSTGNLASSFFAEKIPEGYGIGNIDYLNQQAPYWYWIEHGIAQTGRRVPPGHDENKSIAGTFAPGIPKPAPEGFRSGRFQIGQRQSAGGGVYPLNPKKPIEAHNYIEKTVARIPELANQVLNMVK